LPSLFVTVKSAAQLAQPQSWVSIRAMYLSVDMPYARRHLSNTFISAVVGRSPKTRTSFFVFSHAGRCLPKLAGDISREQSGHRVLTLKPPLPGPFAPSEIRLRASSECLSP